MTNVTKKKVIILGGGVAGLSAAHHLLTKAGDYFEVEIYERRFLGGKARSAELKDLPTEHGFRFFPGFYKHVTETMKEIPLENGGNVYKNNLVNTKFYTFLFSNKNGRLDVPINVGSWFSMFKFKKIRNLINTLEQQVEKAKIDITDAGKKRLFDSMIEVYSSCNARIESTYDNTSWSEFIDAKDKFNKYGKDFENLLATGISKNLVAVRADIANSRTGAKLIGHMLWHIVAPLQPPADKILNAPTNKAWIDPWKKFLVEEKGLKIHINRRAVCIEFDPKEKIVTGFRHDDVDNARQHSWEFYQDPYIVAKLPLETADYIICAMPIERTDELLERSKFNGDKIKTYDHTLSNFKPLWKNTEWMTGIMYYFDVEIDISDGHITIADEDAAITMISQMQYWKGFLQKEENRISHTNTKNYTTTDVRAVLSVIISNWNAESKYIENKGIKLKNLKREEVIEEVKEIIFRCEIEDGVKLSKYRPNLLDAFLDDSIVDFNPALANPRFKPIEGPFTLYNKEPLFINKIHSYHLRPTGYTSFSNFFLASDFIKTNADLGCMDSADEAARRAVNNIFAREKRRATCKIDHYNLPTLFGLFDTARIIDYREFLKGHSYRQTLIPNIVCWFFEKAIQVMQMKKAILLKPIMAGGLLLLFILTVLLNLIFKFILKQIYVTDV